MWRTDGALRRRSTWWWPVMGAALVLAGVAGPRAVASDPATTHWGAPADLFLNGTFSDSTTVKLSADGSRAMAVWTSDAGNTGVHLLASFATISGGTAVWGHPWTMDGEVSGDVYYPVPALSADGRKATVVWQYWTGTTQRLAMRSATVSRVGTSATMGPVVNVSAPDRMAHSQSLALSDDGERATILWADHPPDGVFHADTAVRSVTASIRQRIATLGEAVDLSPTGDIVSDVALGASRSGDKATAMWTRAVTGRSVVFTRSATITGVRQEWGGLRALSDPGAGGLSLAVSADGTTALAAWEQQSGQNSAATALAGHITDNRGHWSTPEVISDDQRVGETRTAIAEDGSVGSVLWAVDALPVWPLRTRTAEISESLVPELRWGKVSTLTTPGRVAQSESLTLAGGHATALWLDSAPLPDSQVNASFVLPGQVVSRTAVVRHNSAKWGPFAILSGTSSLNPSLAVSRDGTRSAAGWSTVGEPPSAQAAVGTTPPVGPLIESVSPTVGPTSGGTAVTVKGSGFAAGASVSIGGVACRDVSGSTTQLTCTTPRHAKGRVDVVVTNPGGGGSDRAVRVFRFSPAETFLRVRSRPDDRDLVPQVRRALVRSVRTDGRITHVRTTCALRGHRLTRSERARLCGFKKQVAAKDARVTALPVCSTGLRLTVQVTARKADAAAARWRDTWRVAGRGTCRLHGTG